MQFLHLIGLPSEKLFLVSNLWFYLKLIPENPQVLRLGVQVAGVLKDKKMSENVLNLMTKYNKEALPLAKKFIENAFKSSQ